jgi:hypothetical protein
MVAANSGRPGGAVGLLEGGVEKVHAGHTTQEEDVIANWLVASTAGQRGGKSELFNRTIHRAWGMVEIDSYSPDTLQGVDYKNTTNSHHYSDAWVVLNATVCQKQQRPPKFLPERSCPVTLVFCAGPNAGCSQSAKGSTSRTLNILASKRGQYSFFRQCVKETIRTGLDAAAAAECTVALIARISCGIYAGPHRSTINRELLDLCNELMREEVTPGRTRASYFQAVLIPGLIKA